MLTRAEKELGWALSPTEYRTVLNAHPPSRSATTPKPDGMVAGFAKRGARTKRRRRKSSLFYNVDTDFLKRIETEGRDAGRTVLPGRDANTKSKKAKKSRANQKRKQKRFNVAHEVTSARPSSPNPPPQRSFFDTPEARGMARLRQLMSDKGLV